MTSTDEAKHAENEAAFRQANEAIRATERELGLTARPCAVPLRVAIAPGHPSQGDVIEEHEGYLVVSKTAAGGAVARALDPRGEDA